jgi:TP901 family phage tail tape measure protein
MPGTYQYDLEIKSNVEKLLKDMKQVQDRLDTVEGREYTIKFNIDEKKLSSVISNLEKMLDSLGKGTGNFKQFENLSKELSSIVSEVQSISKAFGKIDDSGAKTLLSSIQNIDKSLSELSQNILNVNKNMSNMGGNTSGAVKQVENISNAYQDAAKEAEKLADAQSKIGQKTNISNGMKDAFQVEGVENKLEEVTQSEQKVKQEAKETNDVVADMTFKPNTESFDDIIAKFGILKENAQEIVSIVKSTRQTTDGFAVSYDAKLKNGTKLTLGENSNSQILNAKETVYSNADFGKAKVEDLKSAYKELTTAISEYKDVASRISSNKALDSDEEKMDELLVKIEQLQNTPILQNTKELDNANAKLEKIENNLDVIQEKAKQTTISGFDKRLESYNKKTSGYNATIARFNDGGWTNNAYLENVQAVKNAVKEYEDLLNELKGKDASLVTNEDINKLDNYEKKIKDIIATVTNMSASEKGYNFVSGQKELDKIHKLLAENSKMSSEAKAKIRAYYAEIESGNPSMSLDKIHGEILKIYNAEVEAGRAGRTLFDTLKNSGFHQIAAQMAGMVGVYDVINVIKQAASTVTELNTQITELAKVSEQSSKQIYADFDSYADIAKEIRGTISDTIAATADWSKNGYSIPDAKQLAEISQLYKNVGDGIDIDTANESLISTLKGFQLEADQAEHIVDVFNEVSNNESISSGGIGEALQRSAASFNAASTSLEKSVSLVTATNSVLQDPEKVGNMWRTVSARLRGSETELKEMGEDTDGLVTSTSKLQALVKGITGFDIMKDKDTYKDIYDIVLGIGEKWQDLSDIDRASLLEALAGKQQSNALAAALSNIDILKKSYEEATNAEGSARKENEEYSKSIQASIDLAQAKLEQLANDTLNSNFLKGAIDAGGKLIEVLDGIVKSGNAIPTLLAAIGAGFSFKNVGEWNYISKSHSNNIICFIV